MPSNNKIKHDKLQIFTLLVPQYICPKCSTPLEGLYSRCHKCYKNKYK